MYIFPLSPYLQAFKVLKLSDYIPPRTGERSIHREKLKTSSDNNMFLHSPVSGEFQFSTDVTSAWNAVTC